MMKDEIDLPELELGTYIHPKSGKLYEVLGVALQTETNEAIVVYKPLYESKYELYARPYDMFVQTVEIDGETRVRFERMIDE